MSDLNNKYNVLLLVDYKGRFATKFRGTREKHISTTMDTEILRSNFQTLGYDVDVKSFTEVDPAAIRPGTYVLYASNEERGFFYKHYIEDVIHSLELVGCIPLPGYKYLHAHGNKVFQELLRKTFKDDALKQPSSIVIGELSEIEKHTLTFPLVLKVSAGAGGQGVVLVKDYSELVATAKEKMKHKYCDFYITQFRLFGMFVKRAARILLKKNLYKQTVFQNHYTNKIILQSFIEGLDGDYKVLSFAGRYFVLSRMNRKNDFRASGSGLFRFPTELSEITGILDFAERAAHELNTPLASLDIGVVDNSKCYLIEFQCLFFGPYTLQYAPCCFYRDADSNWIMEEGSFELEDEYTAAIDRYIHQP